MKLNKILILFLIFFLMFKGIAQDTCNVYKHYWGLSLGQKVGSGFSYRYQGSQYLYQISIAPYTKVNSYSRIDKFNVGLMVGRILKTGDKSYLFAYWAGRCKYIYRSNIYYDYFILDSFENNSTYLNLNTGVGLGAKITVYRRLDWMIMSSYGFSRDLNKYYYKTTLNLETAVQLGF